ncbi:hypothetical protein AV530_007587 [Patagioenas fasciata monilis]|uniref:Uncharacterized protein n=1 Tax=Patagioenas fasciata monilis TaxID=372326 RepID=A0A1V4JYF7_PATFA|nr:hypothetical protein AV530_007587 [Patagioenas fasciata monilis]
MTRVVSEKETVTCTAQQNYKSPQSWRPANEVKGGQFDQHLLCRLPRSRRNMLSGLQDHKPQKFAVWKNHTGPTYDFNITQCTAPFSILSTLKESHIRRVLHSLRSRYLSSPTGYINDTPAFRYTVIF